MRTRETDSSSLVSMADITEIELVILKRLREVTIGEHRSSSHGTGFDLVGLRDWQAGDRLSAIDWAQSTLTNFSPLMVREFDQPSTATVIAIVDRSLSTWCGGVAGRPMAATVARAIATIGMSAVFFQDPFGLITLGDGWEHPAAVRPRTGKSHVVHCLDAYQHDRGMEELKRVESLSMTISGYLRSRTLLPVISDFLFEDYATVLRELSLLDATHDVFLVLVDSSPAFAMPPVSAGWIETVDIETGVARTISRRALRQLGDHVRRWQDNVTKAAKEFDLDVVRIGLDETQTEVALGEFVVERRLRKTQG